MLRVAKALTSAISTKQQRLAAVLLTAAAAPWLRGLTNGATLRRPAPAPGGFQQPEKNGEGAPWSGCVPGDATNKSSGSEQSYRWKQPPPRYAGEPS